MKQPAETGFTLVEMLVALTIFAILAAAGVGLLRSSVDTQTAVEQHMDSIRGLGRLEALLSNDFGQSVDRPTRSAGGARPAFLGEARSAEFVRSGLTNMDGDPRPDLQRVRWTLEGRNLARRGFEQLDGGDESTPGAVMARDIDSAAFRYRRADGSWAPAFVSTDREPLPAAIELTLRPATGRALTFVVALPRSPSPDPGPVQAT